MPSNIIYRLTDNSWWRWPEAGGLPQSVPGPKYSLLNPNPDYCYYQYGEACYSPAGRYKLVEAPASVEGGYTAVLDGVVGHQSIIQDTFVYTEGLNTFAWSPDEKFLLMAQGEGAARLVKVNPVNGEIDVVWHSHACGIDPMNCGNAQSFFGFTDPIVFTDGSLGFVVQSYSAALYPPPGVYRLSLENELTMLIALPTMDISKVKSLPNADFSSISGHLLWSPDKSAFLFYDFFVGNGSGVRTLLLGKTDGSALWDLSALFSGAKEFLWEQN